MTPAELRELALVCTETGIRELMMRDANGAEVTVRIASGVHKESRSPAAASVSPPQPVSQPNADDMRETRRKARERYLEAMESAHTSGRGWPDPGDYGLTEAEVS